MRRCAKVQESYEDTGHRQWGAANNAGIGLFRVADDARFVNVFARKANLGDSADLVLARNMIPQGRTIGASRHLATLLGGVVFIGEPPFRACLDLQSVGLSVRVPFRHMPG